MTFEKGHKINVGIKRSVATRKKMSLVKMGNKNPMYGKVSPLKGIPRSEETRKKIGLACKGIPPWNTGKKWNEETRKKMSLSHKGQKRTAEQRARMSKSRIGNKGSNWRGGKSFEPYDKTFNLKFKRAIRERDNQVCMLCGIHREKINEAFNVHHIDYNKLNTLPQNCNSLCRNCHAKTNHNRKHWTRFFQSLLAERYGYEYSEEKDIIINIGEKLSH